MTDAYDPSGQSEPHGQSGQGDQYGRPQGPSPGSSSPEGEDRLRKQRASAADMPTVTAMPGVAGPTAAPPPSSSPPPPPPSAGYAPYPAPAASQPYGYGAPGAYGYGAPGGYGYGAPGGYGWPPPRLPQGLSVAALTLGIIGLVLVTTCWGSFLGVLVSPVALGLGASARRKVDRGELGGRSYATTGFVTGIIGTVLSAVAVTVIILMFTVWQDELEDAESDPYTYNASRTATLVVE